MIGNQKQVILCLIFSMGSIFNINTSSHGNSTDYYSKANLTQLNAQGARKHAPLIIFIDQKNEENPLYPDHVSLTQSLARTLELPFAPIILVSRSIVYNHFFRLKLLERAKIDIREAIKALDRWLLYEVPDSQFLLFVPNYYLKYYKTDLGLTLHNLKDITNELKTGNMSDYLARDDAFLSFSVNNLRSVFSTVKPTSAEALTQTELRQQSQLPIWDIILHGHGGPNGQIAGLSASDIQPLLNLFNNELSVGTVYIDTCNAGGENLNILEFDVNKDIAHNFNYILIVGAVTDAPTYSIYELIQKRLINFYNNAALLQGKGASLNRLLQDLRPLHRFPESPHGTSDIPQIWLPGGLGFQTYRIDESVQILNNVKVRKHEDEKQPIILPDSSIAALIYTDSIGVPISVSPYITRFTPDQIIPAYWRNVPTLAENLTMQQTNDPIVYPALTKFSHAMKNKMNMFSLIAQLHLYPQFISMIRGAYTQQHFTKIILEPPIDQDVKKFTGVLHFLRDTFLDIGGRSSTRIFFIDELVGNNDISLILESIRQKLGLLDPSDLELELRASIGKPITLKAVRIQSNSVVVYITFIFNDKLWVFSFNPYAPEDDGLTPPWNLVKNEYIESYLKRYKDDVKQIHQDDVVDQKTISEALSH